MMVNCRGVPRWLILAALVAISVASVAVRLLNLSDGAMMPPPLGKTFETASTLHRGREPGNSAT